MVKLYNKRSHPRVETALVSAIMVSYTSNKTTFYEFSLNFHATFNIIQLIFVTKGRFSEGKHGYKRDSPRPTQHDEYRRSTINVVKMALITLPSAIETSKDWHPAAVVVCGCTPMRIPAVRAC